VTGYNYPASSNYLNLLLSLMMVMLFTMAVSRLDCN